MRRGWQRSGAWRSLDDRATNAQGTPGSCRCPGGDSDRAPLGDANGRLRREDPEPATLVRIEDQCGDLGARMRVELRERRGQVRLDRALGEVELVRDLAVREPAHDEPQDLLLAVRQRLAHDVLA